MNYIGDDFSWDKLIVVCYPGGYGGDFFCNLLQMNYDPNHTFMPNINNKFEFITENNIRSTDIIFDLYENRKTLDKFKFEFIKHVNWNHDPDHFSFRESSFFKYLNVYKQIENEDFFLFKKNYIQYIRNVHIEHMKKFLKNKKVITTQHHTLAIENFSIHEVFPKALIYFLYSENEEYVFLFRILGLIKNLNMQDTPLKSFRERLSFIATHPPKQKKILFDDMIGIDVGKLFFENDGYENEVEQILSNTLNEKIILDKILLKKYKKDNLDIIKKMLDISENIHELTSKELVKIILENYLLFDRASIPDHEFKRLIARWGHFL